MSTVVALTLAVQFADKQHRTQLKRAMLKKWVSAALAQCDAKAAEITLRFVSEDEGRELNHQFRGKDYATNVLTFDYANEDDAHEPVLMADIVICSAVIAREADEQGKTLLAHYAHMTIHGVLHACGYDHVKAKEAKQMEALEVTLMSSLGFDNPYQMA